MRNLMGLLLLALVVEGGCGHAQPPTPPARPAKDPLPVVEPRPSLPDPEPHTSAPPVLIKNGTVMTAAGAVFAPGYVLLRTGKVAQVGPMPAPVLDAKTEPGLTVVDATGKFITPGIIDPHSHIGVFALPGVRGHDDGNEFGKAIAPSVNAEDGFATQDPAIWRVVAGGVTTIQVLPGSINLIGGKSFVAKLHPENSARMMRFPGAPVGLKMACGENPKRVYGERGGPSTRMGSASRVRAAFARAAEYGRGFDKYTRDLAYWRKTEGKGEDGRPTDPPQPPSDDPELDMLLGVLQGKVLVHAHCYRADDMNVLLDIAEEQGFAIRAFHHATDAYKISDRLAKTGVGAVVWADWWGFKIEAYDAVPAGAAILEAKGVHTTLHSDDPAELRHLNHEAAKAMTAGRELGIAIDENQALRWITANPAWVLGIGDKTGTLEVGKMADVVVWSGHPFSVYSLAQKVFIDGELAYDRDVGPRLSDFELGQLPPDLAKASGGQRR
jgi:imidazolonepropionase-like amidohydrolase